MEKENIEKQFKFLYENFIIPRLDDDNIIVIFEDTFLKIDFDTSIFSFYFENFNYCQLQFKNLNLYMEYIPAPNTIQNKKQSFWNILFEILSFNNNNNYVYKLPKDKIIIKKRI